MHRRKSCVVGCDVRSGIPSAPCLQLRFASAAFAKSIAPCRMHLQKKLLKNLHGGLRCGTRGCI
jgi:hypothetical protein